MSKKEEFCSAINNKNFFYHISMPRSATNYIASLLENVTKMPRFDALDEPFSKYISYLSDDDKKKSSIFFTTHECFWYEEEYNGCQFAFSDGEKLTLDVEDFRKIIVQVRDPIEVFYSLDVLGNQIQMYTDIDKYNRFVNKWCSDYQEGKRVYGNKFIILYDDFVNNSIDLITDLCNFLNISCEKEDICRILERMGDKGKFFKHIKTDEIHLKNEHTLLDSYAEDREKFFELNKNFYEKITVKNLKNHFKSFKKIQ